jgi:tRNA pseudouridine55 synthase
VSKAPPERGPHGVLVIDKPRGMTSHDVVARVRRALATRRVGHAGTLDPMATGVLVVLVGEATKLAPWLTAHDKRYRARVELGVGTDSFDADGAETGRAALPPALAGALVALARAAPLDVAGTDGAGTVAPAAPAPPPPGSEPAWGAEPALAPVCEALAAEAARTEQEPPRVSAIHVDGRRAHERSRAGEVFELEPRPVAVRAMRLAGGGLRDGAGDLSPAAAGDDAPATSLGSGWVDVELHVGKGYYVRAFARDLGARLGVPAHLSLLHRTASGPFADAEAVPLDAQLGPRLLPLAAAARRGLPEVELTEAGAARAAQGKVLDAGDFVSPPPEGVAAWISHHRTLIAVGTTEGGRSTVVRGFSPTPG